MIDDQGRTKHEEQVRLEQLHETFQGRVEDLLFEFRGVADDLQSHHAWGAAQDWLERFVDTLMAEEEWRRLVAVEHPASPLHGQDFDFTIEMLSRVKRAIQGEERHSGLP